MRSKLIDCITFFDNNFMFELRYNILSKYVDYFVICESKFDHSGKIKKKNFIFKKNYNPKKIKYFFFKENFPKNLNRWQRQAFQRELIINQLGFAQPNDYIFFSDPDEIVKPNILKNFKLKKKFGIFFQKCFNFKFNLFNPYETPWEGTRVVKKKNLNSIDFLRQQIKSKNLNYSFIRIDKEKSIQIFKDGGWHFNNIMTPKSISSKLKTFAHKEFSSKKFSSIPIIKKKINKKIDLFDRGHEYKQVKLDKSFPRYILNNKNKYKKYILN